MNVKIPKVENPIEGEIRIIDDTPIIYTEGEWRELNGAAAEGGKLDLGLSLYDVNKQIIAQLPDLSGDEILAKEEVIKQYDKEQDANFYMMLCNELKYYTLFQVNEIYDYELFSTEVINCLVDFADSIKAIDLTKNKDAIEIWFMQDNNPYVMYLFNYEYGVIDCGR